MKGVWTKFLAVLIAVAMVIPLAFSGWASNRVYAEEGDSSGSGTSQTISDEKAHQIKTNDDFFSSLLALDSSILNEKTVD